MPTRRILLFGALAIFLLAFLSNGVEYIVEYLWMDNLGYARIFLSILTARALLVLAGFAVAFAVLWVNLSFALKQVGDPSRFLPPEVLVTPLGQMLSQRLIHRTALIVSGVIALLSAMTLSVDWEKPMLFLHAQPFGHADPIFERDASFYIFTVPFLDQVQSYVWSIGFFALLGIGAIYFMRMQAEKQVDENVITLGHFPAKGRIHMAVWGALMLLILAAGVYLDRFEELHRAGGLFTGPGHADIYGTLPVLALKAATAVVVAGGLLFALPRENYRLLIGFAALFAVVWVGGNVYSTLLQRFVVAPNELEKERPFLQHHIQATNSGFGLGNVEERPLTEVSDLTAADIANNRPTVNNVRLWDHEPLLDTFAQIQEIRTYYDFVSVDNDRYRIDGELRQTMLSPRELNPGSLPSRTWVNERLTFTHGYGVTVGPVNRVNEQGLPVLFVQDLPPRSVHPELAVANPEIYYGELADQYAFVKTNQQEFNYPEGEKNIFSTYDGKGGVVLDSLWRRLLFAVYLRDMKLLLSEDFTPETRILLFRNIFERTRLIAPFFFYDPDPYMVIHEGRLMWIFDLYTVSGSFPYSEQIEGTGNYMRNPIKAVIDARDGTVTFFAVQPDEPIAKAYASMFPGMMRPLSDMPPGLRAHLRHPPEYFRIQSNMYATYHMLDVNTFYNKEDQWSIPAVGNKLMEPYFTVMKLPGEQREEFILMLPFTPSRKDNLAAWMVARSDGEHYGQLVVYTFPKQKLIFGPKQMVARINQDPVVSQQITLWDQSGSNVIRGTLLVIPIENSLVYIQPLYLKAEDGRIPELKRVIVGYQNSIAMGTDLEDALAQIFGSSAPASPTATAAPAPATPRGVAPPAPGLAQSAPSGDLSNQALRHYRALDNARRVGDWSAFGRELESLGRVIEQMSRQAR